MRKIFSIVVVLTMSLILASCANKAVREGVGVDERGAGAAGSGDGSGSSTSGISDNAAGSGQNLSSTTAMAGADDPINKLTIYFDYDSSALTAESRDIVEAHAGNMAGNPGLALILEGHADERGTREYNVALGEERAASVSRLMEALGVPDARVETVSYGEERPATVGGGEESWGKNRRVELVYTN